MDDKISIEIENLCIEGSAAALTALIGAVQGRPQAGIDVKRVAEEIARYQKSLTKKLIDQAKRDISEEERGE